MKIWPRICNVVTTNLEFAIRGEVLAYTQMAAALIERFVHRGHHVTFEGTPYRLGSSLISQRGSNPTAAATEA